MIHLETVRFHLADLILDGEVIPLDGYPRFDNPYTRVDFDSRVYEIEFDGMRLKLDFESGTREFE